MGNENLEYPAKLIINKELLETNVSTYVSSARNGMEIEIKNTNKLLSLYGFNSYMVSNLEIDLLKNGHFYMLNGEDCGVWFWGPLGDPIDGKFEIRKFNNLKLGFMYKSEKLWVRIEGISKKGEFHFNGSLDPNYKGELIEWDFRLDFNISKENIKDFLGLDESVLVNFN